jgi:hypothetical protein
MAVTTAVQEMPAVADFEAAGEASRKADALIAEAHELDRQRKELLADAAFEQNLAERLRERGRARDALGKAERAEAEASDAYDEASEREADAARQAVDARHGAETAASALERAHELNAEPAELTELDMRATSAARVAEHAESRLGDAQSERNTQKRFLDRARQDTATARAKFATAQLNALEENIPRPPIPASEVGLSHIFAAAAQNMVTDLARRRG